MRKIFAIAGFLMIFAGCNAVSINNVDETDKIVILPTLNFSGYEISEFPGTVYRDVELAKMFGKLDENNIDFGQLLQKNLYDLLKTTSADVKFISETNTVYDRKFLKSLSVKSAFNRAFFCVVSDLSMKNLFTDREFYITFELVNIDSTGSLLQRAKKSFVIHLPDSAFTPLGVDFSKIINQICVNMLAELT